MKHLRRDKIFRQYYYKCSPDSTVKKSLKIGQYLMKLKRIRKSVQSFRPPCRDWATVMFVMRYCDTEYASVLGYLGIRRAGI